VRGETSLVRLTYGKDVDFMRAVVGCAMLFCSCNLINVDRILTKLALLNRRHRDLFLRERLGSGVIPRSQPCDVPYPSCAGYGSSIE
jgi:hypothetical protein